MADYGIKISKAGVEVTTVPSDSNKKDFQLLSTDDVLKISQVGYITSSQNIAHNLGFIPMFDSYSLTNSNTKAHLKNSNTSFGWELLADATYLYCNRTWGSDNLFYIIFLNQP